MKTINPKWNPQTFEFILKDYPATPVNLEIIVMDYNRILGDEMIGKAVIDLSKIDDKGLSDWVKLQSSDNKPAGEINIFLLVQRYP